MLVPLAASSVFEDNDSAPIVIYIVAAALFCVGFSYCCCWALRDVWCGGVCGAPPAEPLTKMWSKVSIGNVPAFMFLKLYSINGREARLGQWLLELFVHLGFFHRFWPLPASSRRVICKRRRGGCTLSSTRGPVSSKAATRPSSCATYAPITTLVCQTSSRIVGASVRTAEAAKVRACLWGQRGITFH